MRSTIRGFVVLAFAAIAPALAQSHVLGVLGGGAVGADDAGAVVEIDPSTGAATPLATPMPGEGLTGIATLPNGRVYASTSDITGPAQLIEVSAQTGVLLDVVGPLTDDAGPLELHDLTADPTTGVLYGISVGAVRALEGAGSTNAIFTVDPGTAVVTFVGTPAGLTGGFMAIAFTNDGTLWGKVQNAPELYQIDKSNGAVLATVIVTPSLGGLGLGNAGDDTFYMSECCTGVPGNTIYRVDRLSGVATLLGSAGGTRRVHDFTVAGTAPSIVEIPTLGGRALLLFAAALLAAGGVQIGRRRSLGAGPRRPAG